jgi:serine-protein kinase ATM
MLQQYVLDTLLQFISWDDPIAQSFIFLCFAAIARYGASRSQEEAPQRLVGLGQERSSSVWDIVWTHALRRLNVPAVCRAASHTASVLLTYARDALTTHRVLAEIEAFAKDLDVQGPSYPCDSVCHFLSMCLHVASQDVRLYRMQLEEKVLSWLVDNWKLSDLREGIRSWEVIIPPYVVADILGLMESICSMSQRSKFICRLLLPDCDVATLLVEEHNSTVIRDFLLSAQLPPFKKRFTTSRLFTGGKPLPSRPSFGALGATDNDLAVPTSRERKLSTFLLRSLESMSSNLNDAPTSGGRIVQPSAVEARRALDLAVISLMYESALVLNGTRSNRRVVQAACKLVTPTILHLTSSYWEVDEKALVLLGLEPLIALGVENDGKVCWEAMPPPGTGTGIRREILHKMFRGMRLSETLVTNVHHDMQRIIWQSADVSLFLVLYTLSLTLVGSRCFRERHGNHKRLPPRIYGQTATEFRRPQTTRR